MKLAPLNATWLAPSGRFTVPSFAETADGPVGFWPASTVNGVQIARQSLVEQRILPDISCSDVYSVRPLASTSTSPVPDTLRVATVMLLEPPPCAGCAGDPLSDLLLHPASTSAPMPAPTSQLPVIVIFGFLLCRITWSCAARRCAPVGGRLS